MRSGEERQSKNFEDEALPHLDVLYRTAVRLVGDGVEAQDLVQEVYLQAWKSFDRFEPGTNCRAWLFMILFNKLHHVRRRKYTWKFRMLKEADGALDEVAAEPPVPDEVRDEEILAALEGLSIDFREVVLLADVQEFSYREIAEILVIPIGTVMSRLSRGRTLLRARLAECARDYGVDTSLRKNKDRDSQR